MGRHRSLGTERHHPVRRSAEAASAARHHHVSLDLYIGYAVGGITDFLFVPMLVGAAVGWDRFASTRGPAAWRGPVLMGLAMAIKQTPWLIVPFVVVGIVAESQENGPAAGHPRRREVLRHRRRCLSRP